MSEERIWELLAKKLSGEATAAELEELQELHRQYPELHNPIHTISESWQIYPGSNEDPSMAFERHINRMKSLGFDIENTNDPDDNTGGTSGFSGRKKLAYAIPFLLMLITVFTWWLIRNPDSKVPAETSVALESEVSTRNGSRSNVVLPDGTQIWLNAGSKLNYSKNYGVKLREVSLTGEAFFDVAKDKNKPFIIHTPQMDIRVLGTAFNVKAYQHERTSETSLIRGSIEVHLNNRPDDKIILKPNQKLIISNHITDSVVPSISEKEKLSSKKQPIVVIEKLSYWPTDQSIIETSWMENKLVFQNESFREIANRMERWYGVHFVFQDENLEQLRLTGNFQSETLVQALNALKITAPFRYEVKDNTVTLHK